MKKTIVSLLALVMLSGLLAGCGSNAPGTGGEDGPQPSAQAAEFALGSIDADVYENSFAGLRFTLPDGWSYANQAELESMMGVGSEVVFGDDPSAAEKYAMESSVYDMMAYGPDNMPSVIVMFENLSRYLGGVKMTEDGYLDQLAEGLVGVEDMKYEISGRSDMDLGGESYRVLTAALPDYGMAQSYCVRRVGDYILCVIITDMTQLPGSDMGDYFA